MTENFSRVKPFIKAPKPQVAANMCLLMVLIAGWLSLSPSVQAQEKYWTDPATGFAMGGYDVVSYWSSTGPVLGNAEYEVEVKKVTWRFSNKGNYEEFLKYTNIYAPQFSGYGAYAVSQGRAPLGNPTIWVIADNRLYFFFSTRAKTEWQKAQKKFIRMANKKWPTLKILIANPY
jgi:YHS domain-containing protein